MTRKKAIESEANSIMRGKMMKLDEKLLAVLNSLDKSINARMRFKKDGSIKDNLNLRLKKIDKAKTECKGLVDKLKSHGFKDEEVYLMFKSGAGAVRKSFIEKLKSQGVAEEDIHLMFLSNTGFEYLGETI
jgi:predicted metal-dependent phosphotriesterase family hydrolase